MGDLTLACDNLKRLIKNPYAVQRRLAREAVKKSWWQNKAAIRVRK